MKKYVPKIFGVDQQNFGIIFLNNFSIDLSKKKIFDFLKVLQVSPPLKCTPFFPFYSLFKILPYYFPKTNRFLHFPFTKPLKIFKLRKSTFKSISRGIKFSENLRVFASKRRLQRISYVIYIRIQCIYVYKVQAQILNFHRLAMLMKEQTVFGVAFFHFIRSLKQNVHIQLKLQKQFYH